MEILVFTCEKCGQEIKLSEGTTKMGVKEMADQYGEEWLSKVNEESGERVAEFVKEVKEHSYTCGGAIKLSGLSTAC